MTMKETAPCPAAHVVVMSQCEVCGNCQFKNVKCTSKKGLSEDEGYDESFDSFMYKQKQERMESQAVTRQSQSRFFRSLAGLTVTCLIGATVASLAVAGVVRSARLQSGVGGPLVRGPLILHAVADSYVSVSNLGDEEA